MWISVTLGNEQNSWKELINLDRAWKMRPRKDATGTTVYFTHPDPDQNGRPTSVTVQESLADLTRLAKLAKGA